MDLPTTSSVSVVSSVALVLPSSHLVFTQSFCSVWQGIPPSPDVTAISCSCVSCTLPLRTEPCLLSAEPVLWRQICMSPITHISAEWILSFPALLKELLSWLTKGGRMAICLMHTVVYTQETSGALVSGWNNPACKEQSFLLGIPQCFSCWDYGLLYC